MKAGEVISSDNIKIIRPGSGMESRYLDLVVGRKLQKDVPAGTPLTWDII